MKAKLTATLLLALLSSPAIAAEDNSENNQESQSGPSLLEEIFTAPLFTCDTYPECDVGVSEEEQMTRDSEQEKKAFEQSKTSPKKKTKTQN